MLIDNNRPGAICAFCREGFSEGERQIAHKGVNNEVVNHDGLHEHCWREIILYNNSIGAPTTCPIDRNLIDTTSVSITRTEAIVHRVNAAGMHVWGIWDRIDQEKIGVALKNMTAVVIDSLFVTGTMLSILKVCRKLVVREASEASRYLLADSLMRALFPLYFIKYLSPAPGEPPMLLYNLLYLFTPINDVFFNRVNLADISVGLILGYLADLLWMDADFNTPPLSCWTFLTASLTSAVVTGILSLIRRP